MDEGERLFEDAYQRKVDLVLFRALDRFSREGVLGTLQHLEKLNSSASVGLICIGWRGKRDFEAVHVGGIAAGLNEDGSSRGGGGGALEATGGGDAPGSAWKDVVLRGARVYTVAAPGPKWKILAQEGFHG